MLNYFETLILMIISEYFFRSGIYWRSLQNAKRTDEVRQFCNLNFSVLFSNNMSDLDRQIEQLRRCEIIKEFEVKALCSKAREILVEESNVQRVDSPVTVSIIVTSVINAGKYFEVWKFGFFSKSKSSDEIWLYLEIALRHI